MVNDENYYHKITSTIKIFSENNHSKNLDAPSSKLSQKETISSTSTNPYVEIYCTESIRKLKFLVDTGAHISIILVKPNVIKPGTPIFHDDMVKITGVGKGIVLHTLGYSLLHLEPFFTNSGHKFHLLPNEGHNIPFDGILGHDFFQNHGVTIDYENQWVKSSIGSVPLFITQEVNEIPKVNIPARTEQLIEIEIINPEIKEGIIPELNLSNGLYLSRAVTVVNAYSRAYATILNSTNAPALIGTIRVELEPFPKEASLFIAQTPYTPEHRDSVLKKVRDEHLNSEEKSSLHEIINEYDDIFHVEGDSLSMTNLTEHEINTGNHPPISVKTYRYPEVHKSEVEKQIKKFLKEGIIQPSLSPWSAPLWVVPKKLDASGETKWRVVIDYRKLNNVTVGDAYNLPNITEILDQLGHSVYFTILDLVSGFHQIPMRKEDIPKTAFTTPSGHWEFTRMPFGLKNAPARFQRMIDIALIGLNHLQCFTYLDDVIVFAKSISDHETKLRSVFDRLRLNNLKLQPDKCEFMRHEVTYLGHVISEHGVKPNPDKVRVVEEYPIPSNAKEVKQFLGLCGFYRRFIENFSKITQPLTKLLKKDQTFFWSQEQQRAFEILKSKLISEPILQYPDFSKEFILTTDASNFSIGAVLSQNHSGSDLPIAYASRTLNRAESNYNTTERELLSIVWAINHFRPYLYGRKFSIVTDHRPLVWLFNVKDPGSKLVRWRLKLEEYDYEIVYKPGRLNSNADALSRIPSNDLIRSSQVNVIQTRSRAKQARIENSEKPISPPKFKKVSFKPQTESKTCKENKETFDDYAKFIKTSLNPRIYDFSEVNDNILLSKDTVAYFTSIDLDENNEYVSEILSMSKDQEKFRNSSHELFSVVSTENSSDQKYYHCFIKQNYYDRPKYSDFFETVQNLRIQLENDKIDSISIANPVDDINQFNYDELKDILLFVFRNSEIKIVMCLDLVISPSREQIPQILKENHDSPLSGHCGYHRMFQRIRDKYRWPKMRQDIKDYIKNCKSCQLNKTSRKRNKAPMEITSTSRQAFERLAIDICGPFPITEQGNRFVLTMQDDLTKFSHAVPLPNHEAPTVADNLVEFFMMFGIAQRILSDQGKEFMSEVVKEVAKVLKLKHSIATAYHPETNGALERSHSTLKDYLKHYIHPQQHDWDKYVPIAMFCYNTHVHSSTKFMPYELVFGIKPRIPNSFTSTPEFKYTYDAYHNQLQHRLQKSHEIARKNLIEMKEKAKTRYDRTSTSHKFQVGDFVYLKNEVTKKGLSKKLSPDFTGPYEIIEIHDTPNVTLKIKNKFVKVHTNRLKPQ